MRTLYTHARVPQTPDVVSPVTGRDLALDERARLVNGISEHVQARLQQGDHRAEERVLVVPPLE